MKMDTNEESRVDAEIDPAIVQRIRELLGSSELQPLVRSLDRRLGKQPSIEGSVMLSKVSPETIDAVCGLLGRPPSPIFAAETIGDAHGLDLGRPLQRWLGEVIDLIANDQIAMRYHGDFDAAGLQIASQMIVGKKMTPWRMGVSDYERATDHSSLKILANQSIPKTLWDRSLQECLQSKRVSVLEEMVVAKLLDDLSIT